jgi:hypothetical protein
LSTENAHRQHRKNARPPEVVECVDWQHWDIGKQGGYRATDRHEVLRFLEEASPLGCVYRHLVVVVDAVQIHNVRRERDKDAGREGEDSPYW